MRIATESVERISVPPSPARARAELIDGRFCPVKGCGGLTEYRRALRDGFLLTVVWCWSCGREWETHRVPYEPGRPPGGKP